MNAEARQAESDFIDEAARDRVVVEGADAQTYLQSQIAQELGEHAVGETQWTLVLDPSGKVHTLARITRTSEESFALDTDAGFGEGLATRLARYKIRVAVEISTGPAEMSEPSAEHEAARVAAGWPRMGFEIIPGETIPAVTGLLSIAVNFTKGCYPGQELVERMDSRGADAPRSLRILEVGTDAAPGDGLAVGGQPVGKITSVSPRGGLALAYVKRGSDLGRLPPHAL